jgi:hypothetical protein
LATKGQGAGRLKGESMQIKKRKDMSNNEVVVLTDDEGSFEFIVGKDIEIVGEPDIVKGKAVYTFKPLSKKAVEFLSNFE